MSGVTASQAISRYEQHLQEQRVAYQNCEEKLRVAYLDIRVQLSQVEWDSLAARQYRAKSDQFLAQMKGLIDEVSRQANWRA